MSYLNICFTLATDYETVSDGGYGGFSYYTYSHRVRGQDCNSSRFAYGSISSPKPALNAALPVLQHRNIKVSDELLQETHFYGLGWDFEAGHFKLYFRFPDWAQLPNEFSHLTQGHAPDKHYKEGLISRTYAHNEAIETKVYIYPKAEAQRGLAKMLTTERGQVDQLDLDGTTDACPPLNETGQAIVAKYSEIEEELDTIAYKNRDDFTLYFP